MPLPQLCATVTGRSAAEIRAARDGAVDADLVELRLDTMERPDPAAALHGRRLPAIVTCRPVREGGHFRGSEEERRRILEDADALGAEFIDVEWDAGLDALIRRRDGRGVIVSRHDFSGTPANVCTIVSDMRRTGAEIVKVATTAHSLSDLLPLLDARSNGDGILIGMGMPGVVSRILAARFGSRWTYAGDSVAPGQLTSAALLQEFRFRRIRPDAAVYGVVGRPVSQSLSAAMHNAGFAALGLNAVYVPLEAADIDDFKRFADRIGVRGASITIPFKRDVMRLLDDVAPLAMSVGAVNTLLVSNGRWTGTNTDVEGFLEPLRRRTPLRGLRATVLGAGGATRAAAFGLRREGAHVTVAARRQDAAVDAASAVGANAGEWPPPTGSWDILVNATPVGSRSVPGSPIQEIGGDGLVYDLVYDPDPTELMQRGASAGCRVIGGLEMLVAQAERQFELWTGQRPPADLFAHAAAEAIRTRRS
jgi:3-dehydroquinate dehydratase / shikimate dehydrogenase